MSNKQAHKIKFIKPPNKLKTKVGSGGIDEKLLQKSQDFIDHIEIDFMPYAKTYLKGFAKQNKIALNANNNRKEAKDELLQPVMQLKANGGMFRYQLLSDVADIALQFLEAIDEINKDAYDVLSAHEHTMQIIIKSELKGDGGREGYALVKELDKACKRYFSKHTKD